MATQILPLPFHLGLDRSRTANIPVRLHIKTGSANNHAEITDDFGREVVLWAKQSMSLSQRRLFYTPEGYRVWTMRAHASSVVQGCFIGGRKGWYFEGEDGRELGFLEPESLNGTADYHIGFVNRAGRGEKVQLRMRGKITETSSALLVGNIPVVLFQRAGGMGWYGPYASSTYQALVAPGCDLVWVASLISALDIAGLDR